MSVVPHEIPDVGATSQRLKQNPRFDPLKAGFGTEEYFVWSRFDGATTVKDLILMTGLAVDRAIAIVRQLRRAGAILVPHEEAPASGQAATVPSTSRTQTTPMRRMTPSSGSVLPAPGTLPALVASGGSSTTTASVARPDPTRRPGNLPVTTPPHFSDPTRATMPGIPSMLRSQLGEAAAVKGPKVAAALPPLDTPSLAERAMHAEPGDLSLDEKTRILVGLRLVATQDPWVLVGVPVGTDKRDIKRAFFERSKLFHPDRFYGRKLATWEARINTVFEAMSTAHGELMDPRTARREDSGATAPQSPTEYAAELFDRACLAEVSSELASAMKLFAAAVKLDPLARYLRRAASCALAAGELQAALDHARKATALEPSDPSIARTLARALRALERLDDAEEVLVMALAMKNENDTLSSELAADLGVVRAALARR